MASLVDEIPAGAVVTLVFEDGQASGRAACNSYGGAYDAGDDGSLSFEGFAVTQMACEPELMTLESAYLEALGTVTGFAVDGKLTLHGDGIDLTFDEEVPPVALPLVGTTWTLTTIASGDAVSSVLNGTEVTAEFTADGTVSGSAGCNRYSGSYTWTGDSALVLGARLDEDGVRGRRHGAGERVPRVDGTGRVVRDRGFAADALRRFRGDAAGVRRHGRLSVSRPAS